MPGGRYIQLTSGLAIRVSVPRSPQASSRATSAAQMRYDSRLSVTEGAQRRARVSAFCLKKAVARLGIRPPSGTG